MAGQPPGRAEHLHPPRWRGLVDEGVDERSGQGGEEDDVVHLGADVGDPHLDGRERGRRPGIEVDHALVEHGSGRDERVDRRPVPGGRAERLARTCRRPPVPHDAPPARVPGVLAVVEGRVRRQCDQQRQPGTQRVDDPDACVVVLDVDVDVHPAHRGLPAEGAERVEHPLVAFVRRGHVAVLRHDERARRHEGDAGPVGRLARSSPGRDDVLAQLVHRTARLGGRLDLLQEQLLLDVLVLVRRALVGAQHALGDRSPATRRGVHQEHLLLDPDLTQLVAHVWGVPSATAA